MCPRQLNGHTTHVSIHTTELKRATEKKALLLLVTRLYLTDNVSDSSQTAGMSTPLRAARLHLCWTNAPARPTAAQRQTSRPCLLHPPFWSGYQHSSSLKLEAGDDLRPRSLSSRRQTNRDVLPASPPASALSSISIPLLQPNCTA